MAISCITCFDIITNIKDSVFCIECDLYFCNDCIESIYTASDSFDDCTVCRSSLDVCNGLHCMECNSILKTDKIFKRTIRTVEIEVVEDEVVELVEVTESKLKVIGECIICCDDMTIESIIQCNYCHQTCCKECFKRYILESGLNVKCMHQSCKHQIDFYSIIRLADLDIELYYSHLLFNIEQPKIVESESAAESYMIALDKRSRLPFNPITGEYTGKITNQAMIEYWHVLNYHIGLCIQEYGIGYENYDWDNAKIQPKIINKSFRCPNSDCNGRVKDSKCIVCCINVCMDCHEIIHGTDHTCNPDTIASIEFLNQDSRPCPVCSALIFKIEGCDQMFCTQCHTTFSWTTSRIETGFRHNPHYLDWIRQKRLENPNMIAQLEDVELIPNTVCNEYISYDDLKKCFHPSVWDTSFEIRKKLPKIDDIYYDLPSEYHYCLAIRNLHSKILKIRSTIGNHMNIPEPNNHDLRVKFISGLLDDVEFKKELYKRHLNYTKSKILFDIYEFVFHSAGDIFSNLSNAKSPYKNKITRQIYLELQRLLEIANKYLSIYESDKTIIKFCQKPFN